MAERFPISAFRAHLTPRLFGVLLLVLVAGSACKPPDFVRRRVDNFTAYYNTFYNARKAYENGVKSTQADDRKVDRLRFMEIFSTVSGPQSGRDFENAIRKSADVLRDHPESKWVDDALLLIGQSYFQQRNFVGAEQKFREVIDLGTSLEAEGRFWLARTLIAAGSLEAAEGAIGESLAEEGLDRKWEAMLRLALGELRVREQDFERAAEDLGAGLERVNDREVGARAQFLLGQVLERLGRYEESVRAYRRVDSFTPPYELSYAARYSAVRVQGLHVDEAAALREIRRLERDGKHFGYRAELAYLRGRVLQAQGRADDAWQIYDELLYDPLFASLVNDLRGRIHYALGELYRDLDRDFVRAAAHFDTASAQLRTQLSSGLQAMGAPGRPVSGANTAGAAADPRLAPEAIVDGDEQKEAFGAYAKVWTDVARMDSLLALGRLDDEAYAVRILEIRQQLAREAEEQRRLQEARQVQAAFARSAATGGDGGFNPNAPPSGGAGNFANDPSNQAGFLFHKDAARAEEGMAAFRQKWGDRPLVRNWRRIEAVTLALAEGLDPEAPDEFSDGTETGENELPEVDESAIPRDSTSQARMVAELARARYELANTLFLAISRPDSAAAWYRMILEETPREPVAQRALYALAEVQQALGDEAAAQGIFRRIVDETPDSEFADLGRTRLGLPPRIVAAADTAALAEAAYAKAYALWSERRWTDAIDSLLTVASDYPASVVRPRSLLAVGSVFIDWSVSDSLALDRPIPMGVADSVLVRSGIAAPPGRTGVVSAPPVDANPSVAAADSADGAGAPSAPVVIKRPRRAAETDSISTVVDSLGTRAQPPGTIADSTAVADSVAVDADSTSSAAPGSSRADSLAVRAEPPDRPATTAARVVEVDSLAWRRIDVRKLLTTVGSLFRGTPHAERAGAMAAAVEELLKPAVPDSSSATDSTAVPDPSVATADSLALPADSLARADSLSSGGVSPPDAQVADSLVDAAMSAVPEVGPDGVREPWVTKESALIRPLDDVAGEWTGWMIVLQELDDLALAPAVRERYEMRLREYGTTEILMGEEQGRAVIHIALGRFETREEAEAAAERAGWAVPPTAWLLHVLTLE